MSDVDGTIDMFLQKKWDGVDAPAVKANDSLLARTQLGVEYEKQSLSSVRLDSFFSKTLTASDDFGLWIDVEGAFKQVYEGAKETLSRTRSIFIEVEDTPMWVGQWLSDDVQAALENANFYPLARDFEGDQQYNILYIHHSICTNCAVQSLYTRYLSGIAKRGRS